jgi:hypothetical protein
MAKPCAHSGRRNRERAGSGRCTRMVHLCLALSVSLPKAGLARITSLFAGKPRPLLPPDTPKP